MKAQTRKNRQNTDAAQDALAGAAEQSSVVQSQSPKSAGDLWSWNAWCESVAQDVREQQREAGEWMGGVMRCWLAPACAAKKLFGLRDRVWATWRDSGDAVAQLAVERGRVAGEFVQRANQLVRKPSSAGVQAYTEAYMADAAGSLLQCAMLPVRSQARLAGAFAEFWSLPSTD